MLRCLQDQNECCPIMINELSMWSTLVLSQMYQEKMSHPVLGVLTPPPLLKAKVDNMPPAQSTCTTVPFQIISQLLTGFCHNFCII